MKNVIHKSDCAQHNEPAMPNGECTCGAVRFKVNDTVKHIFGYIAEVVAVEYDGTLCVRDETSVFVDRVPQDQFDLIQRGTYLERNN